MKRNSLNSYDVIVVGCGIAGLSAAVSAVQEGARVLILERAPRAERGGNTRYTDAYMRMKSSFEVADDFVDHLAVNSSCGYIFPDLMAEVVKPREDWPPQIKSLNFSDPELLQTFADSAGPTIQWLESFGIRFSMLPIWHLTGNTERWAPSGGGLALIDTLAEYAEKHNVEFAYGTSAQSLIQAANGSVVGLRAFESHARTREFRAKAIVLACGGFEGNFEMMARYLGPQSIYLRPLAKGGYYNKGEGIRMALEIGAAPSGDYSNFHASPADPRSPQPDGGNYIFPYGILVNRLGKRFIDEAPGPVDRTYEAITREIFRQPRNLAYIILDAKVRDIPGYTRALRTDQKPEEAGSIEQLASRIDLPPQALAQTVAEYNGACGNGRFSPLEMDALSTRGLSPPKSNFARPLDTPPFQGYPIICSNCFTFGGVKVDAKSRVLNVDGDRIPGLYAAGEVIGLYYGDYTGATSVLRGAVFGRIAGREGSAQMAV